MGTLDSLALSILCYFLLFSSGTHLDDQRYCSLRYRRLCQGKGKHVACMYPDPGPGPSCRNYTQISFTPELRHFVLNYINKRRQRIAAGTERVRGGALIPKPQIMMKVEWDRELAFLAQRLADQCSFVHDDCRATVRHPYAGQSVGEVRWRGSHVSDVLSAQRAMRRVLDAWWGEKRRVQPQDLVSPFKLGSKGAAWGHFSQLAVWALTAAGCGAARHGAPRRLLLVCDFSHTNMLGQSTLNPGPLAPCATHYARRSRSAYPLLCAPMLTATCGHARAVFPGAAGWTDRAPTLTVGNPGSPLLFTSYDQVRKPKRIEDNNEENKDDDEQDVTAFVDEEEDMPTLNTTSDRSLQTSKRRYTYVVENALGEQTARGNFRDPKGHIIHKIEQELVTKSSIRNNDITKYRPRVTTRFYFGGVRENHENEYISKARFKIYNDDPYYHFPQEIITETTRHKWKQTRQRPRRPGADALLSKPVEKIIHRSSIGSLTLDHEDMEQLFRDTGFHKHWKKQPLS